MTVAVLLLKSAPPLLWYGVVGKSMHITHTTSAALATKIEIGGDGFAEPTQFSSNA